jgi:hypothetical protein
MTSPAREDAPEDAFLGHEEERGRNDVDAHNEFSGPGHSSSADDSVPTTDEGAPSVEDEEGQANGDQDREQSEMAQGDDSLSPDHCTVFFIPASF